MEIHHVHQSGKHTKTLSCDTQDNTDATADGDTPCSSVRYTHTYTLFNTHDKTHATADGYTSYSSVRYTHKHSLFNTQDNTDATADGDTSCSSVRYTHTNTLSLILKIIQTPRQMELHLVHQSGTHTQTHTNSLSRSLILKIIQTPRQMEIHHNISQVHTHTFSSILMIIQTPRQMEISHIHQSGTHIYTLSLNLSII